MNNLIDSLTAARAEALFTSALSARIQYSRAQVTDAIRTAVHTHGGTRGCAAQVAGEYGDHPETAALRMRWARHLVNVTYPHRTRKADAEIGRPEWNLL
jgi:hypothetical protein